jgi:hemoglobin-like flavoprotein
LGLSGWHEDLDQLNIQFETGQISREAFIEGLQKFIPNASADEILQAWSAILDFLCIDWSFYKCCLQNTAYFTQ